MTARRIVYWMRKVRVVPRSAAKYHTMRCAPFAEQVFSPKVPGGRSTPTSASGPFRYGRPSSLTVMSVSVAIAGRGTSR